MARSLLLLGGLLLIGPAAAQRAHVVRLTGAPDGSLFRFTPGRLTVKPGDQIEFRAERGAPFAVSFEIADFDARAIDLMREALSLPRGGELRSPVLADSGSRFRFTIPALRAGVYRFRCLTHMSYRMSGLLVVQ